MRSKVDTGSWSGRDWSLALVTDAMWAEDKGFEGCCASQDAWAADVILYIGIVQFLKLFTNS